MSLFGSLHPALESIDFQKSRVFFDELILAVGKLRGLPASNRNAVEVAGITKIIFHHTGINLDGEYVRGYFNASILPPFIDARSPLLTYLMEGLKATNADRPGLDHSLLFDEGTIDLANGRVTGVFSKVTGKLQIGSLLFDHLTDQEIAAVILHEVGHQFAYFEYIVHSSTLAVNLNWCATELSKATDKEQRVKLIINASRNLDVQVDDPAGLADASDPKIPLTVLMETYTRRVRSGTGADFYDYRSWEALADQFATRQGAGRDLVVGLDKIHRLYLSYTDKGGVFDILLYTCQAITATAVLVLPFLSPLVGGIVWAIYGLILSSPFPPEGTYDNPKERLARVKNELVGALKDKSLPVNLQKQLHDDIKAVDELISKIGLADSWINAIWRILTAYRRENYKQVQFQAELEKLANNELFLASSKLNTLAD